MIDEKKSTGKCKQKPKRRKEEGMEGMKDGTAKE